MPIDLDLADSILVVVDMEPDYRADMLTGVRPAVTTLVTAAVEADILVIFLQFYGGGTLKELLDLVRAYDGSYVLNKSQADGSAEVIEACNRASATMDHIVVCGVNTHCCVEQTAWRLAVQLPKSRVTVVKEACGARQGNDWSRFTLASNMRLHSLKQVAAAAVA